MTRYNAYTESEMWRLVEKAERHCDSCDALMINGVYCHETGCPDAWKDARRECPWCGATFTPEERYQKFCSEDCAESYNS